MGKTSKKSTACEFMGTTVLGERGQIVIPKEIREMYKLKKGDKFIVAIGHQDAIALIPMERAKKIMDSMTKQFNDIINND
jgi:AbrB family looped-hinge helix DNA binding protein